MKKWQMITLQVIASIVVLVLEFHLLFGSVFICFQQPVERNKTEAMLAEIENAMSRYHVDFGFYPQWDGPPEGGAALLFQELRKGPEKLSYLSENFPTAVFDGKTILVDIWGNPIRYRMDPPDSAPDKRKAINPTYDLWSTGGSAKNSDEDQSKWITNWF